MSRESIVEHHNKLKEALRNYETLAPVQRRTEHGRRLFEKAVYELADWMNDADALVGDLAGKTSLQPDQIHEIETTASQSIVMYIKTRLVLQKLAASDLHALPEPSKDALLNCQRQLCIFKPQEANRLWTELVGRSLPAEGFEACGHMAGMKPPTKPNVGGKASSRAPSAGEPGSPAPAAAGKDEDKVLDPPSPPPQRETGKKDDSPDSSEPSNPGIDATGGHWIGNGISWLRKEAAHFPAARLSYSVVLLSMGSAIAAFFLGQSLQRMVVWVGVTLLFAVVTRAIAVSAAPQGKVISWVMTALMCGSAILAFISFFFGWPLPWRPEKQAANVIDKPGSIQLQPGPNSGGEARRCVLGKLALPRIHFTEYTWRLVNPTNVATSERYALTLEGDEAPFIPDGGFRTEPDGGVEISPLRKAHHIVKTVEFVVGADISVSLSAGEQRSLKVGVCHYGDPKPSIHVGGQLAKAR